MKNYSNFNFTTNEVFPEQMAFKKDHRENTLAFAASLVAERSSEQKKVELIIQGNLMSVVIMDEDLLYIQCPLRRVRIRREEIDAEVLSPNRKPCIRFQPVEDSPREFVLIFESINLLNKALDQMRGIAIFKDFHNIYNRRRVLGVGAHSLVEQIDRIKDGKSFAAKFIKKNEVKVEDFIHEYETLCILDHPNIIHTYEAYETKEHYILVLELIHGDNLKEFRAKKHPSEDIQLKIIEQLLESLVYLESKKICHRDIKPDNIMVMMNDGEPTIKLVDFGIAIHLNKEYPNEKKRAGTPGYISPEVFFQDVKDPIHYNYKSDIFSVGAVFYFLESGRSPFCADQGTDVAFYNENYRKQFSISDNKLLRGLSDPGKNLLSLLLNLNADQRPTAKIALDHKCFSNICCSEVNLNADISMRGLNSRFAMPIFPKLKNPFNT